MDTSLIGLGIFSICLVMFIGNRIPASMTALVGCILMVLFNVASFETVFGQFASNTTALLIGTMIVSAAIEETGLAKWFGRKIYIWTKGNELAFLLSVGLCASFLSAFSSNLATTLLFIPVIKSYCEEKRLDARRMLLPMAMACQIGGTCTLVGAAPQMVANAFLESNYGMKLVFFDTGKVGILLTIALIFYIAYPGRFWGRRIWRVPMSTEGDETGAGAPITLDKKRVSIVSAIFLMMIVTFYTSDIPEGLTAIIAAVACFFSGCIKSRRIYTCISWNAVIKLGGTLGIMRAVTESGGIDRLVSFLGLGVTNTITPYALFAIFVVCSTVFSEVLSNSTAMMLFLPLSLVLCQKTGMNEMTFAIGLILASSVACSTPLTSTAFMIVAEEKYKFTDFVKYGMPFSVMAVFIIILAVPVFFPL